MSPWQLGKSEIDALIAAGDIQRFGGPMKEHTLSWAEPSSWSHLRDRYWTTTRLLPMWSPTTPRGTLEQRCSRKQCLRAIAKDGHVAIEKALNSQFGGAFLHFRTLRRRRHELDYPVSSDDFAENTESARAIESAEQMVKNAQEIIKTGQLTAF